MYRVLVVDDELYIAELLRECLSRIGFDVETASSGQEGLRLFNREHFDLVITDVMMEGMDGRFLAQQIRSSDRACTPVIGMSGTPWVLQGSIFDATLAKPFPLRNLVQTVETILRGCPVEQGRFEEIAAQI